MDIHLKFTEFRYFVILFSLVQYYFVSIILKWLLRPIFKRVVFSFSLNTMATLPKNVLLHQQIIIIYVDTQPQDLLLQASPTRLVGTSPQQALQEDIPQQALQKTLQNLTSRKTFHNKHGGKHSTTIMVGNILQQAKWDYI